MSLLAAYAPSDTVLFAARVGGGLAAGMAYLLASRSFSDLVDHVQLLQRENDSNTALIHQIAASKKVIAARSAALTKQTAQLAADQSAQLAAKQRVEAGLHSLQARKSQISSQIQQLIDQQQQRADAAAAAAAASASGGGGGSSNIPVPPSSTLGGQAVAIAGVPGHALRVGRRVAVGLRLLRLHDVRVRAAGGVAAPQRRRAVFDGNGGAARCALEPGDLVFFDGLGHVGIYVGGGSFIHAPHTGDVVRISSLSGWYSTYYVGARRIG